MRRTRSPVAARSVIVPSTGSPAHTVVSKYRPAPTPASRSARYLWSGPQKPRLFADTTLTPARRSRPYCSATASLAVQSTNTAGTFRAETAHSTSFSGPPAAPSSASPQRNGSIPSGAKAAARLLAHPARTRRTP